MMRMRIMGAVCAGLLGSCAATAAFADNPAGFYLGTGEGYSTVRSDDPAFGYPGYFNDHQFAWKLMAGIRPIPFLGGEIEYIDFGQPDIHHGYYDYNYYGTDSHPLALDWAGEFSKANRGLFEAVEFFKNPAEFRNLFLTMA